MTGFYSITLILCLYIFGHSSIISYVFSGVKGVGCFVLSDFNVVVVEEYDS